MAGNSTARDQWRKDVFLDPSGHTLSGHQPESAKKYHAEMPKQYIPGVTQGGQQTAETEGS